MSATTKGIMLGTLIFSAIGLVAGVFLVPYPVYYAIGVGLGCAMSVLKTFLLERSINKITQAGPEDKKAAQNAMRLGYMSRYLMTAAVLLAAVFLLDLWGLVGTLVGTVAMTLAAVVLRFFVKEGKN
jgi:predicted PurR-regulated permease PerM